VIRAVVILAALPLLQGFEDPAHFYEQRLFGEINDVRIAHHLAPLSWNARMGELARRHSTRMVHHHFLSHEDPEFGGPGNRLSMGGISWRACAENIYQGYGHDDPVHAAIQAWLNSSGHRVNILNRVYTSTGIGVAIGPGNELLVTQLFADIATGNPR